MKMGHLKSAVLKEHLEVLGFEEHSVLGKKGERSKAGREKADSSNLKAKILATNQADKSSSLQSGLFSTGQLCSAIACYGRRAVVDEQARLENIEGG